MKATTQTKQVVASTLSGWLSLLPTDAATMYDCNPLREKAVRIKIRCASLRTSTGSRVTPVKLGNNSIVYFSMLSTLPVLEDK